MENKGANVRYNKINITFPDMVIVQNIIPRNMIINLGCASVNNHIPRDDIFDYHHIREGNIYIIYIYMQWNRKVYDGGDKDVPGLHRYRPDAVPVETRLLPASFRFTTVFDSLPGCSR